MFLLGLENRFVCLVYFRLTEDIKIKSAQLFSSPSIFVRKPGRQTVTYKLAFKLYITICATGRKFNRKVQCVSFV